MDVSMPITTVVPSLDGPVLAALATTSTPMGLAAVHARAGRGSKSGVRSVLLRMVDQGLVLEVPGGYVLNQDHIAAPAVELLASLHGELARRIRAAVDEWPTRPELVGMFGSAARREGDASSDIDVLVVSDDPDLDDRVDELAERIRRWTGNRTQVIGRPPKELARLRRAKEPILSEWTRDLVVILGDDLRQEIAELGGDSPELDAESIANLCRRFHVRRLSVFGSAATEEFDPSTSDVDFLVEFEDGANDLLGSYFGLKEELERLLGRPVDLVMPKSLENPYFAESVERTRRDLYAA